MTSNFMVAHEKTAGRPRENYNLTRFAAYLVAINGNPIPSFPRSPHIFPADMNQRNTAKAASLELRSHNVIPVFPACGCARNRGLYDAALRVCPNVGCPPLPFVPGPFPVGLECVAGGECRAAGVSPVSGRYSPSPPVVVAVVVLDPLPRSSRRHPGAGAGAGARRRPGRRPGRRGRGRRPGAHGAHGAVSVALEILETLVPWSPGG